MGIATIEEIEPVRHPEERNDSPDKDNDTENLHQEDLDPDKGKTDDEIRDEINGQMRLFD